MRVESVVPDFLTFWGVAAGEPRARQRELWRERYEGPHQELFDLYYTNWAAPNMLDGALDRFAEAAPALAARAAELPARVERVAVDVAAALGRPEPDLDVVLLVGLFSSDGWLTEFRGRPTLFFAVEYVPRPPYDEIFFAHECAHVVHRAAGFAGETVASAVFAEGFAVGLSTELVPGHGEAEYLWMRSGMDAWLSECVAREDELRARLRADLDSEEADVYARWFLGRPNDTGLPPRSGYFVAHRWIRGLGVPFDELVAWDGARARAALS